MAGVRGTLIDTGRKDKGMEAVKLNLGCGYRPMQGYINIDLKRGQQAYPLNISEGTADEIRAAHLLEHFPHKQVLDVVKNWASKLKVGGVLKIAVPDFGKIVRNYQEGRGGNVLLHTMGDQNDKENFHKCIFDEESLTGILKAAGLEEIKQWESDNDDTSADPITLNLQGTKRQSTEGAAAPATKIHAVMSVPRLMFTDCIFSAIRAFIPLGIQMDQGQGVFWEQVLTRMIEPRLEDGTEYIFTVDYDTWFTKNHVMRLCQLMMEHPEADAIVPLQMVREGEWPLMALERQDLKPGEVQLASVQELEQELVPLESGHFGLTLFKTSAFRRLKKPWFLAKPGPDQSWNEGRLDPDIAFWANFKQSGCKVFLAPEVKIGHLQLMCTFPGTLGENWKPQHYFTHRCNEDQLPRHCIPKVELKT